MPFSKTTNAMPISAHGTRQSALQLPICHAPHAVHNAKQASAVRRRWESVGRSSSYNEM